MDEHRIPTPDELSELPRLAQVAYVARCVRRVLPLFGESRGVVDECERTVLQALHHVERVAAGSREAGDVLEMARAVNTAGARSRKPAADLVALACEQALCATADNPEFSPHQAAHYAFLAAQEFQKDREVTEAMRWDFEALRSRSQEEDWTSATPVPVDSIGPIWPGREPPGWLTDAHVGEQT